MWGIENASVVFESRCNAGVWQGDPLGAHCMGLAIYDFLEELQAKLQPGSTFEVSEAKHSRPQGTPYAWIIDDLTCVPPDWTWSAQDFTSYWMMRISFVACRLTALAVLHGVQSSMKAHESSN